jgi:hypothetical protein
MVDKKIPGPAFIIIGSAMVLMSVFVDIEKLSVFVLVGAVFILIGFFKIIMKEKRSAPKHRAHHAHKPSHHPAEHKAPSAHPSHPAHKAGHKTPAQHKQGASSHHVQHKQVVRCSSCGVKIHPLFKWCPNCGQKLK